ncbi:Protein KASH5 [Galemys pyrenaicus]|uniref:Protein KASH5 n=1 Tax=Galemys pyrenaicus TaxID=202257 RepID=A0A8J6AIF6_GALPY|nr:Protein KASH5 [Galemys pyrenaicus]
MRPHKRPQRRARGCSNLAGPAILSVPFGCAAHTQARAPSAVRAAPRMRGFAVAGKSTERPGAARAWLRVRLRRGRRSGGGVWTPRAPSVPPSLLAFSWRVWQEGARAFLSNVTAISSFVAFDVCPEAGTWLQDSLKAPGKGLIQHCASVGPAGCGVCPMSKGGVSRPQHAQCSPVGHLLSSIAINSSPLSHSGLELRLNLRVNLVVVEAGAAGAPGPLLVPPSDGQRLLASPAAAESPGWPMDLPDSRAGGPAAKGTRGEVFGVAEPQLPRCRVGGKELSPSAHWVPTCGDTLCGLLGGQTVRTKAFARPVPQPGACPQHPSLGPSPWGQPGSHFVQTAACCKAGPSPSWPLPAASRRSCLFSWGGGTALWRPGSPQRKARAGGNRPAGRRPTAKLSRASRGRAATEERNARGQRPGRVLSQRGLTRPLRLHLVCEGTNEDSHQVRAKRCEEAAQRPFFDGAAPGPSGLEMSPGAPFPSCPPHEGVPLVSSVYLWDQPEEGSLGMLLSLEEQILNSMFQACDPQKTGTVTVTHVLAYLEAVTGRGPQDARLQTLACSLDPNGEGPRATVDLDTFLVVMRDWIAACQLDGGLELQEETVFEGALTSQQQPSGCPDAEEPASLESFGGEDPRTELPAAADLLSSLEDLELSNRRLARENAKLQRSVEMAEEGAARLGEEIQALRRQLRSTQQALQFAKAVDEELEDLKTLAKSLEEQNRGLLAQARQAEKEQQQLAAEMETLQEENGKLLAERDGVRKRSEELAMEKDALKRQLCECESLICQREAILSEPRAWPPCLWALARLSSFGLSQRTHHAENLAKTLEEYRATTQELKLEISHLEEQLSQGPEGSDELPRGAQVRGAEWTGLLPPSLGMEIKAIQQKQEAAASSLGSPLCGVWQWEEVASEAGENAELPPEAPSGEHVSTGAVRSWEGAHDSVPGLSPTPVFHEESDGRKEQLMRREEEEEAEPLVLADLPVPAGAPHPGDRPESAAAAAEPEVQGALVPVVKELVPARGPAWGQLCLHPQHPQPFRWSPSISRRVMARQGHTALGCTLTPVSLRTRVTRHLLTPAPVLGLLLLLLLSMVLLGQSSPPTWPHLQLYYLQPPPV